jgi:4-amino-4-deoxy-L-arabinose transferase-like glycosyltransferase
VLPAFALVYLLAAPTTVRKRVLHLLAAFGAMIVALGWWVAIVELVPASWRPYVGGSENNSVLDLIFGYNGLGRIFGQGGGAGGGGQGGMWGESGLTRLFAGVSGGMIAWLIPAALLLGAIALVIISRAHRSHPVRAAIMLWGGWLIVTGLVFSFMAGIYHDYYTVALAPAIAGLVVVAGEVLWRQRRSRLARAGLSGTMIITGAWAFVLLGRATAPYSTLRWPVLIIGVLAAAGLLLAHRLPKAVAGAVLGLALLSAVSGPAAYALQTAATPHQGSIVTAGPVSGNLGPGGQSGPGRTRMGDGPSRGTAPQDGQAPQARRGGGQGGQPGVERASVNTEIAALLRSDASSYRWAAATTGSQIAAGYQLATELPVMAIGGFNGGDPSPTLEQFQAYVAQGQIHYYLSGDNRGGPGGGSGSAAQIATWVRENFTPTTVGGAEVYDLTSGR